MPTAANAVTLNVEYDATGWSHINTTDSDLWIKPTTLSLAMESDDGTFTGHMPLQPADTKFHLLGFLPVKAQVNFIEAAPVTGSIAYVDGANKVTSTASYYIRLSDVLIGGLPAFVGNNCRTKVPVTIPANTPAGESFDVTNGGRLVGEYTIGAFQNCGLQTFILNQIVPGHGSTIDLNVSNGRISVG